MKELFKPKHKKEKRFHIRMTLEDWAKIKKIAKKYNTNFTDTIITLMRLGIQELEKHKVEKDN